MMAIDHPYLQNLTDDQLRQHINFALEIDNFLTLQTPEQKDVYLKNYFFALTTLLVAFNDKQGEIEHKLGIIIDSSRLLNVIQKFSFYREFRESKILPEFQKHLNMVLENYPNDVTTQFLTIQPLEPLKFDKQSRKDISFKLFKRKTKINRPAQAEPVINIQNYTSKPKLYSDTEHIKTDSSRFLSKLFRTSDEFTAQNEKDKQQARQAFDKAYNKTLPTTYAGNKVIVENAKKIQEDLKIQQQVQAQRRAEAQKQHQIVTQNNDIERMRAFEAAKLAKTRANIHIQQQQKNTIEKEKKQKHEEVSQKIEHAFTYADAELHKGEGKNKKNEELKYENYSNSKSTDNFFDRLFDKLFPPKYKPINSSDKREKTENISQPAQLKIHAHEIAAISTPRSINQKESILSKLKKGITDYYYRKIAYNQNAKKTAKIEIDLNENILRKQSQEIISQMDKEAKKANFLKSLTADTQKLKKQKVSLKDKLSKLLDSSDTGYVVQGKKVTDIDAIYEYRSKKYKASLFDRIFGGFTVKGPKPKKSPVSEQIENPVLKIVDFNIPDFTKSLDKTISYPLEFLEETIFEIEQRLIKLHPNLFLNFSKIDKLVTEKIIDAHAKYMQKVVNIEYKSTSDLIKKYSELMSFIDDNRKLNDLATKFTKVDFEKDFILAQYIAFRFRETVLTKYFAEYKLEKIYSQAEVELTGVEHRKVEDMPVKVFNINSVISKDINNQVNLGVSMRQENNNHDLAIIFTVQSCLKLFKAELETNLRQESKMNLTFFSSQQLSDAITYIATEIFLTKYARSVYLNLDRGELDKVKKHIDQEFKIIAKEFIEHGFSASDNKALIRDLYFNLSEFLTHSIGQKNITEIDKIIEAVITSVCKITIQGRLFPQNFYKIELRESNLEERIYYEVKYALDVYLIPENTNSPVFSKFNETFVITFTRESRDIIERIASPVKNNPDYIQKIINMTYDTSVLKRKLADLTYTFDKEILIN